MAKVGNFGSFLLDLGELSIQVGIMLKYEGFDDMYLLVCLGGSLGVLFIGKARPKVVSKRLVPCSQMASTFGMPKSFGQPKFYNVRLIR